MNNLQDSKKKEPTVGSIVFFIILIILIFVFVIFEDDILYSRSYTPEKDAAFTVTMIETTPDATVNVYHLLRIPDGKEIITGLAPTNGVFGLNDTVGLVKFRYKGKTCYSVTRVK